MYKQTLCVTLPISAAVIIAAALFANAGDLDPPEGPIEPTMHTLQEIYDLVQQSSPCGGCTWEYAYVSLPLGQGYVEAVPGSGVLHGIWLRVPGSIAVRDGFPVGNIIADFFYTSGSGSLSQFFELNVAFENGVYIAVPETGPAANVTVLYRSTNP